MLMRLILLVCSGQVRRMNSGEPVYFCCRDKQKCQSDWIYIKDTIEQFYSYNRTQVKLNKVYMDGKGNYKKKQKEIQKLVIFWRMRKNIVRKMDMSLFGFVKILSRCI